MAIIERPLVSSSGNVSPQPPTEREHILQKAAQLVQAGWDGVNEENFQQISETPQRLRAFSIEIERTDFADIQRTALGIIATGTVGSNSLPPSYERAFENLRRHLLNLANPFAVSYALQKLTEFHGSPIDPSRPEDLLNVFLDPKLPSDTSELLQSYYNAILKRLVKIEGSHQKNLIIEDVKTQLGEFLVKLREHNTQILEEFKDWGALQTLFRLPGFTALKDGDYKKLMHLIHLGIATAVRKFISELQSIKALNPIDVERYLKDVENYEYDFDTLISDVTDSQYKPKKREGIAAFWNHPSDFFVGKTMLFGEPSGEIHSGIVIGCTRDENGLRFCLQDQSKVHIDPSFKVTYEKRIKRKLWTAIFNGVIKSQELFHIELSPESDNSRAIPAGRYKLQGPTNVKGGYRTGNVNRQNYFECNLTDERGNKQYLLKGIYTEDQIKQIQVYKIGQTHPISFGINNFERIHLGFQIERKELVKINKDNADTLVTFKEEPNEDKLRLLKLDNIQRQLEEIRSELLNESHRSFLDLLIDDFTNKKLKSINFELLSQKPELLRRIRFISQRYYDDLKIERSPQNILIQLVLESLYAIYVPKKDNILIAKTMELLQKSFEHTEKLTGKDLVFFVGNTGSGKSTAIGYFMGAKIAEFKNYIGETALRYEPQAPPQISNPTPTYPRIGQAIGTSETIYTQGFEMPNADFMLGDSPGFNDTRGGHFEVCTAISFDQAVERANTIRSVVVVVQANDFLSNRGNNFIELINIVKERFPDTFKPETTETNPRVFLLVTKTSLVENEVLARLKDGTIINEFVSNVTTQVSKLKQEFDEDSFEVQSQERRLNVWTSVRALHMRKQVHFIDIKSQRARPELLKQFSQPSGRTKVPYQKAMQSDFMQKKFADCVFSSTHTWNEHIFEEYFDSIPKTLRSLREELMRKEQMQATTEQEKNETQRRLIYLNERIPFLETFLNQLQQGEKNLDDPVFRAKVAAAASSNKTEVLEEEKKHLKQMADLLAQKKTLFDVLSTQINELEPELKNLNNSENRIKERIQMLSEGDQVTQLFQEVYEKGKVHSISYWKSKEARQNALIRLKTEEEDYLKEKGTLATNDYEGETSGIALIKKDYRLVPNEPLERQRFLANLDGEKYGGYIAQIEGLRFVIDLGARSSEDGKHLGYGFKLTWKKGEDLPWIRIKHVIPRKEVNAIEIANLESDITKIESKRSEILELLEGNSNKIGLWDTQISTEAEIKELDEKINILKLKIARLETEQVEDAQKITGQELSSAQEERAKMKTIDEFNKKIAELKNEIKLDRKSIDEQEAKLRKLAIVIVTHWESARLLRHFAELVTKGENSNSSSVLKACANYISLFDKYKDSILTDILIKYGFEPVDVKSHKKEGKAA